jgi:hypothetical protein
LKLRIKEIKEPSGWQGNIFYPDGTDGQGFGIEVLSNGRVWFPRITSAEEKTQSSVQEPGSTLPGSNSKLNVTPVPMANDTCQLTPAKRQMGDNSSGTGNTGEINMSTVNQGQPGPKKLNVPLEMIKRLNQQGLGSKAIARELRQQDIRVSYRTIERRLTGSRK